MLKDPTPTPGAGPYEILSGSRLIGGQAACMRPGVATSIMVSSSSPWNAMMSWSWAVASGGTGFTLTSNSGTVLMYTPKLGLNVQLQPYSDIDNPAAAWIPVFTGQANYFAIVSAVDQTLALTIADGGPPWNPGQRIDAEAFDPSAIPPTQAWLFAALGEDGARKAP